MTGVESSYDGVIMVKVMTTEELLEAVDALHTQAIDAELPPPNLRTLEIAMDSLRQDVEAKRFAQDRARGMA